jgi:hypothetical protein
MAVLLLLIDMVAGCLGTLKMRRTVAAAAEIAGRVPAAAETEMTAVMTVMTGLAGSRDLQGKETCHLAGVCSSSGAVMVLLQGPQEALSSMGGEAMSRMEAVLGILLLLAAAVMRQLRDTLEQQQQQEGLLAITDQPETVLQACLQAALVAAVQQQLAVLQRQQLLQLLLLTVSFVLL